MELMLVSAIGKRYGDQVVLSDVSFTVQKSEILGVIGPNGAGKTTLLECIADLLPVDTGEISWGGATLPLKLRKQLMFYVPEGVTPYPELGVQVILSFFSGANRVNRSRMEEVVSRLALGPVLGKRARELSKGYHRRLLLALGLLSPRPLVIMDEPFDGLDLRQSRDVMQLLREEASAGRTLVLSIHQLADAERVCDRFVLLSSGRVTGTGTLEDLRIGAGRPTSSLEDLFLALS